MRLVVLDYLSDPGQADKPNDDSLCLGPGMAAVFDGATGIGDSLVFPSHGSDAAWLAQLAAGQFYKAAPEANAGDMVRKVCRDAALAVSAEIELSQLPRFAWPTSSFEMARLHGNMLELCGLGDCTAFVLSADGSLLTHIAMPTGRDGEMAAARRLLDASGGFGENLGIVREGATLEALRRARALHNTKGGSVWTLGLEPDAGAHVASIKIKAEAGQQILLMSDGFAALCEAYQVYSAEAMVRAACANGLASLLAQLRHVEKVEDPAAARFARFKQSDDATAILAKICW